MCGAPRGCYGEFPGNILLTTSSLGGGGGATRAPLDYDAHVMLFHVVLCRFV